MTDKQLERGNAIKKELKDLESLLATSVATWSICDGMIEGQTLYGQVKRITIAAEKRMRRLYHDRIALLQKEFQKL